MAATNPRPARTVAPERILQRDLEARGCSSEDLAVIMNRPVAFVRALLHGKAPLSEETAADLGKALGTSPDFWSNLAAAYRLHWAEPNAQ